MLTMRGYKKYPYPTHGMSLKTLRRRGLKLTLKRSGLTEEIHNHPMECNWKFLWGGGLKLMLSMSGYKRYPYPPHGTGNSDG